jgi:hypothetical protein
VTLWAVYLGPGKTFRRFCFFRAGFRACPGK